MHIWHYWNRLMLTKDDIFLNLYKDTLKGVFFIGENYGNRKSREIIR